MRADGASASTGARPTIRPMRRSWSMPIRARCCTQPMPDALRHPASLTKIMTLYLLFEQIEAGRLRLDTPMEVSAHAAAAGAVQARAAARPDHRGRGRDPRAGHQIRQRRRRRGRGSDRRRRGDLRQHDDAQGARARHERTIYANASGLPDDDQITTARDQVTLGRAIQDRFPRYYRYFATRASSIAATRCAITTSCSAASKASTASRPATPARPASIS